MLSVRALTRLGVGPVDLDVAGGEIVSLTGPSGAGKTLLLRAIADLDPNEGAVTLSGVSRESLDAPRWRARVMYVPANAGWWSDTVGPHFADMDAERVKTTLHQLNLETTALGWTVATLSTGERQRLALARAVVRGPDVLLLDEPTSGLDGENVRRAEALIAGFANDGGGVLFVTHDPVQAERLGTRGLTFAGGSVVEVSR
ncbi:MAG: ATP-binding cassette domain-containing protein [Alphaproteobacteria bacterium]|nr:ATP-binding cassette domain-containing protein [Alphaproteobacteria bacterium]